MNTNMYVKKPDNWYADSHPDLANRKPDELFEACFVKRYYRLHEDLWRRITRVHGTLFTLKQLEGFPFDCLYPPDGMEFWRLVVTNFLDMACLVLQALTDTGPDVHSIPRFKSDIMRAPWLEPGPRNLFQQTLRNRKFDAEAQSIATRVREIRNNRIAHRLVDWESGLFKGTSVRVTGDELWQLFDATHALFGGLSFGSTCVTLVGDLVPGTVGGQPTRTCLDEVLDAVLRDNAWVNQPEQNRWWPEFRKRMSPEELERVSWCRKRIGLAEV